MTSAAKAGQRGAPGPAVPAAMVRDVIVACSILDGEALTGAFGHVSTRVDESAILISKRLAPGNVKCPEDLLVLDLAATDLPAEAPPEAWLHLAVYRARHDVGAICRTHGAYAMAASIAWDRLLPVSAVGAFLGTVPTHPTPRLCRDIVTAQAVAMTLDEASAVLLRGNGAVVVGSELPEAVARATFLEANATTALRAAGAGTLQPLDDADVSYFRSLPDRPVQGQRVWERLSAIHAAHVTSGTPLGEERE